MFTDNELTEDYTCPPYRHVSIARLILVGLVVMAMIVIAFGVLLANVRGASGAEPAPAAVVAPNDPAGYAAAYNAQASDRRPLMALVSLREGCVYCDEAKALVPDLKARGHVVIVDGQANADWLLAHHLWRPTFPRLYVWRQQHGQWLCEQYAGRDGVQLFLRTR